MNGTCRPAFQTWVNSQGRFPPCPPLVHLVPRSQDSLLHSLVDWLTFYSYILGVLAECKWSPIFDATLWAGPKVCLLFHFRRLFQGHQDSAHAARVKVSCVFSYFSVFLFSFYFWSLKFPSFLASSTMHFIKIFKRILSSTFCDFQWEEYSGILSTTCQNGQKNFNGDSGFTLQIYQDLLQSDI